MTPWFRKKKEITEETHKPASRYCSCELCLFSDEVEKKIGAQHYELVSPFIRPPSHVMNIDPDEALKEAKGYDIVGDINSATRSYTDAFISAIATEDVDEKRFAEACIAFFEKHGAPPTFAGVKAYRELLGKPDVVKSLREVYLAAMPYYSAHAVIVYEGKVLFNHEHGEEFGYLLSGGRFSRRDLAKIGKIDEKELSAQVLRRELSEELNPISISLIKPLETTADNITTKSGKTYHVERMYFWLVDIEPKDRVTLQERTPIPIRYLDHEEIESWVRSPAMKKIAIKVLSDLQQVQPPVTTHP